MNPFIQPFVSLVDCLADFLGDNAEIALHDLSNIEHSIVKIRNNHVSGRKVGDPATDLVMRQLQKSRSGASDYACNYFGSSRDGKTLRCASYFIRDGDARTVGVLCINLEIDQYLAARKFLDQFFAGPERAAVPIRENLGQSVDEMIESSLRAALKKRKSKTSRLSQEDKISVIKHIDRDGIFLIKGAVAKVAKRLRISEPSVYRYLKLLSQ